MAPNSDLLVDLVHALLANARGLIADARLLHENQRHARSYALAALAGEELGKIELCLDWLLGSPTLDHKEFRRAWRDHTNKLASLAAYRIAFIEDVTTLPVDDLKEQAHEIGRKKMAALYVDFDDQSIATPMSVTAEEATDLLARVATAVEHATGVLAQLTSQAAATMNDLAPQLLASLVSHLDGLAPADAIAEMRRLLACMSGISNTDLSAALEEDRISNLFSLEARLHD